MGCATSLYAPRSSIDALADRSVSLIKAWLAWVIHRTCLHKMRAILGQCIYVSEHLSDELEGKQQAHDADNHADVQQVGAAIAGP